MMQWDTSQWEFPHGNHPCVIISRTSRCQNPAFETVNVLACQSQRATRLPSDLEALLEAEDGMDWSTLVRCDFLWTAPKVELTRQRGSVTAERRRAIGATIIRVLGLWLP
jgi:mRNA-degrading endonuclease toxin of MazEF toxin-antitoxin module